MLIFASGEGRLTVVPSQLNQNSNGANTVYLTGAFPSASVVTVAFTLPDGTNTEPQLMTGDKTVEYNGVTLAVKEYTLPKSITQIYGRVTVQFYIQNGTEVLATEATNITVARGVPSTSTSAPDNIYEQIVAALSSIETELTNKLDKQSGSTPYDMIYAKSSTGEQKMKASSSSALPSLVVERDDLGGVNVLYATKPTHAVPLQQLAEKLAADIAAAIASKLDKAGGTITGDLDVNGDLVVSGDFTAKGKTFIEEATTLAVKNAIIETNAGKTDLKTLLSGLVINKNPTTAYGFVYDPTDDTVKFGQGSVDENGVFTFNSGEGAPIATRADSSKFTAGHLVKWDATKKQLVDAGKGIDEVGKTPKSIDTVNGDFTSITYDTVDGLTLVSIAKIINTDDSEYTFTLSQEIPLLGSENVSIDLDEANQKLVFSIDKLNDFLLTPLGKVMGVGSTTRYLGFTLTPDPKIKELNALGAYYYTFEAGSPGNRSIICKDNLKTINGNSIVGAGDLTISGGGKTYYHCISFYVELIPDSDHGGTVTMWIPSESSSPLLSATTVDAVKELLSTFAPFPYPIVFQTNGYASHNFNGVALASNGSLTFISGGSAEPQSTGWDISSTPNEQIFSF